MFTTEAKYYNLFHQNKNYKKEARELLKKYPTAKTILEVGAGSGLMTRALQDLGCEVTIIEPSEEMLKASNTVFKETYVAKIQDLPITTFKEKQFDLVLALYDVLNYIPLEDFLETLLKLRTWGKKLETEVWKREPVKFFTHRKIKGVHRVRLGFSIGERIFLWYIYFGKGLVVEKHNLYYH